MAWSNVSFVQMDFILHLITAKIPKPISIVLFCSSNAASAVAFRSDCECIFYYLRSPWVILYTYVYDMLGWNNTNNIENWTSLQLRSHTHTRILLLYCNKGKKRKKITKERNTELRWRWSWRRRRKWTRTILEGNKEEEKCVYTLKLNIWFMTLANWTVCWNITFVRAFWHCADWKRSFYWILLVNLFPIVLNEWREKREKEIKKEHTTNTLNAICMQMGN